jgi:hypothetical protein
MIECSSAGSITYTSTIIRYSIRMYKLPMHDLQQMALGPGTTESAQFDRSSRDLQLPCYLIIPCTSFLQQQRRRCAGYRHEIMARFLDRGDHSKVPRRCLAGEDQVEKVLGQRRSRRGAGEVAARCLPGDQGKVLGWRRSR